MLDPQMNEACATFRSTRKSTQRKDQNEKVRSEKHPAGKIPIRGCKEETTNPLVCGSWHGWRRPANVSWCHLKDTRKLRQCDLMEKVCHCIWTWPKLNQDVHFLLDSKPLFMFVSFLFWSEVCPNFESVSPVGSPRSADVPAGTRWRRSTAVASGAPYPRRWRPWLLRHHNGNIPALEIAATSSNQRILVCVMRFKHCSNAYSILLQ